MPTLAFSSKHCSAQYSLTEAPRPCYIICLAPFDLSSSHLKLSLCALLLNWREELVRQKSMAKDKKRTRTA